MSKQLGSRSFVATRISFGNRLLVMRLDALTSFPGVRSLAIVSGAVASIAHRWKFSSP